MQNELFDAIFEVYRIELKKQIQFGNFIALEMDETTHASNQQQMDKYVNIPGRFIKPG